MQMLINCSKKLQANKKKECLPIIMDISMSGSSILSWKKHTLEILHLHLHFENNTHTYENQNSLFF
jgi:hypothetical protein